MGADGSDTDRPNRLGRRTFVKGLGAAGATVVGLSHDRGFAQDAEAIAPLVGAAVVGASVGVGWALREWEVIGTDPPAEGLTSSALEQQIYQAVKTRKSENASTIIDNKNILKGVEHTAYTDAKVAALEELNAGSSESDVLAAANNALDSYETTVKSNFLKSWNESVNELQALLQSLEDHPDMGRGSVLKSYDIDSGMRSQNLTVSDLNYSLPSGDTMTVKEIDIHFRDEWGATWSPLGSSSVNMPNQRSEPGETVNLQLSPAEDGSIYYLNGAKWRPILSDMETTFQNVRDGISTWVTSVYGDVQSGDIEISDLVTPRERAAMMADGEGTSQAIADLIALNIPVDAEREATVTIDSSGATLTGTFALTDSSDGPIESGTTYDPANFSGDVYLTADMSLVEGEWTAFNSGVDGGTITITSEPYSSTAIEVTTAASETVSVPAEDWTENGDGTWSYDASEDLETQITNVDSARFVSTATETQYETIQLQGSFTVDRLVNTQSGEDVSTTSFSNSESQNDSNYITQEEWTELQEQNEKLIEKYENSQSGGGIDLGGLDMFGIPGEIVAVVAAALVALGVLGN